MQASTPPGTCRLLLEPKEFSNDFLLDLPYSYSVSDARILENYLPLCVRVVGIDFIDEESVVKTKYRNVAVKGVNIKSQVAYKFAPLNKYELIIVPTEIALMLSRNPAHGDQGLQIKNQLEKSLLILEQNSATHSYQAVTTQQLPLSKLQSNKIKLIFMNQNFKKIVANSNKKTVEVFMNSVKVPILISKLQKVECHKFKEIVIQDLLSCINIMIANGLYYRSVERHCGVIPIQNYTDGEGKESVQFTRFVSALPQLQQVIKQDKVLQSSSAHVNTKIETSPPINQSGHLIQILILVFALVSVIVGYVKLKGYY